MIYQQQFQITLLLDLNKFFDSIDRDMLVELALDLDYPALPLLLALIIHGSPRVLISENQASRPIHPRYSILQGCPSSVALAKAYLYEVLRTICDTYPDFDVSSWLDDLSFDRCGPDPEVLVQDVVSLYLKLSRMLQRLNLTINTKKSGFLCSHASLRRMLRHYLHQHFPGMIFPKVLDCIRDLGIDNCGGRLRRLATSKMRLTKSLKRAARFNQTPRKLRRNLVQTNVLASGLWGVQGVGISATSLHTYRQRVARKGGFSHRLGCLTTGWRLFADKTVDPAHKTLLQQVSGFFDVVSCIQPRWIEHLRKSWRLAFQKLAGKQRYWHYARGPMTSLICRLLDLQWHAPDLDVWYDPQNHSHTLDLHSPLIQSQICFHLVEAQETALWTQASRHPGGLGLEGGGDLTVTRKHLKQLTDFKDIRALNSLVQGSIPCLENHLLSTCPWCDCEVPSLQHLLWTCPVLTKQHNRTPSDWLASIRKPEQHCFWHRTITPNSWTHLRATTRSNLEAQQHATGLWALADCLDAEGFHYGTDGSGGPNTRDKRCRLCSWGISVVRLSHDGTWECLGTRGGFLKGPKQTVPRAELQALVALLDSTRGDVHVSCDSLVTVKSFRKIIGLRRLKTRTLHSDLWLKVAAHSDRRVMPVWVNSHLSLDAFRQQFGSDMDWAHSANYHADSAAEERVKWLSRQATYRTWGDINRWTDNRLLAIQKHLIPRIRTILDVTLLATPRVFGPKPATKREFMQHLRVTYPHHAWALGCHDSAAWCVRCGLRLRSSSLKTRLSELARQPCPSSMLDFLQFGVHRTHDFHFVSSRAG